MCLFYVVESQAKGSDLRCTSKNEEEFEQRRERQLFEKKVMQKGEWINIQRGYVCNTYFFMWFYPTR